MSREQVLAIVGDNIPDIEKTEYYSNIALVNHPSWIACQAFTDQVVKYLSAGETVIKITKTSETKALMYRKMCNIHPFRSRWLGLYKVDLLHGIILMNYLFMG